MSPRDRYLVEQQEPQGRQPGMFAIRDKSTGELVLSSDGKQPELFTMEFSANYWITMQITAERARGY